MTSQMQIQLGKKGLTTEFLEDIKKRFEKPSLKNMKISVLRSARQNRNDIPKYAKNIQEFLGPKFTYKIIGFSIFIRKWRKEISLLD